MNDGWTYHFLFVSLVKLLILSKLLKSNITIVFVLLFTWHQMNGERKKMCVYYKIFFHHVYYWPYYIFACACLLEHQAGKYACYSTINKVHTKNQYYFCCRFQKCENKTGYMISFHVRDILVGHKAENNKLYSTVKEAYFFMRFSFRSGISIFIFKKKIKCHFEINQY